MDAVKELKETLNSIKLKFNELTKSAAKFGEIMTSDGVKIMFEGEALAVGSALTLEDGSPVPDGTHALENGVTVVCVGGVVTEIQEGEADPTQEAEETPQFATQANFDEAVGSFNQRFESFESKFAELETIVSNLIELGKQQVDAIDKFSAQHEEPAGKPISKTVSDLNKEKQSEGLANLTNAFKNLNKK